ncbi:MAG: hypothetical protein BWX66_00524 [Deltaproteobacteria bacterium ADurb.Bin058]|nr:MAG: hypothetical protein BWX66_00524 [Deltaproteobacteria bacterium ADurb.Bin058]
MYTFLAPKLLSSPASPEIPEPSNAIENSPPVLPANWAAKVTAGKLVLRSFPWNASAITRILFMYFLLAAAYAACTPYSALASLINLSINSSTDLTLIPPALAAGAS